MRRPFWNRDSAATTKEKAKTQRQGAAALEFALCLPIIVLILLGIWETGRIAQVSNILWNGARESARDASLGQDNLQIVASNLLTYLQSAQPGSFGQGHSTTLKAPVISLPANTTGFTCWDNTANQELFTLTFTDLTSPSTTDPTGMQKLDRYEIGVQVPYSTIGWNTLARVSGVNRITVVVDWASMRDAPFQISPVLPAQ